MAVPIIRPTMYDQKNKDVDFDVQNVPKITYEDLYFQKFFQG